MIKMMIEINIRLSEASRSEVWMEKSARLRNSLITFIFPKGLKFSATMLDEQNFELQGSANR